MLLRAFLLGDQPAFLRRFERAASMPDLLVTGESGRGTVRERLAGETLDLVVADEAALGGDVSVASLRRLPERPDVVVVVSEENAEQRARLLSQGCSCVLFAGLPDALIAQTLGAVVQRRREERAERRWHTPPSAEPTLDDFASSSPAMQKLVKTARRVAESDTALLLLGETGSGKERMARAIHAAGHRRQGPFVAINCSAIPEALLESELFGHEKGAFTGAVRARRGQFELAHRGTFFLDEVGDLPLHLQVKLLRVLQDHRLQPVGGERVVQVDVRVMAATSRDLERAIEQKQFRQDLYYRLGVVTLTLPPLRDRREDIPILADAYREHFAARLERPVRSISSEALHVLSNYPWPGNVRELANVLERTVLLCAGEVIDGSDLADLARRVPASVHASEEVERAFVPPWAEMPWHEAREEALAAVERLYLARLLEACRGRVGEASRRSGLNPRSLYEKLKKHGLDKASFRAGSAGSGLQGP